MSGVQIYPVDAQGKTPQLGQFQKGVDILPTPRKVSIGTSLEDAAKWIYSTQEARRNWSNDQRRLVRGRLYNMTKKTMPEAGAMKGKSSGQNVQSSTAETIAASHGVDERTIRRDAKFAEEAEPLAGRIQGSAWAAVQPGEEEAGTAKTNGSK